MEVLVRDRAIRSNVVESRHAGYNRIQIELGVKVLLRLIGTFLRETLIDSISNVDRVNFESNS